MHPLAIILIIVSMPKMQHSIMLNILDKDE